MPRTGRPDPVKPRSVGRPVKGKTLRTSELKIRTEPSENEKVDEDAEKAGLTRTNWIRKRLGLRYDAD